MAGCNGSLIFHAENRKLYFYEMDICEGSVMYYVCVFVSSVRGLVIK